MSSLTELKFDRQVNAVVKNSFFHLRSISKLKSILSFADMEKVVHVFVSSRLDYCMCCFWVWIRILSLVCSLFRTQLLDFQQVQGERAYYSCWSNRIGYLYDTEFTTKCCCMFSRLCMVYHLTVTDWISVCQSSRYLCSNDRLLLMVTRSRLKWINVEVLVLSRFPCFV